ncbi:MAG: glycosyltransferase, partial [Gemmatimonadaceae bacterium]
MSTHAHAHLRTPDAAIDDAPVRCVAALIDTAQVSGPGRQLAALAIELRSAGTDLRVILLHRAHRPYPAYAGYLAAAGVTHAVVHDGGRLDFGIVARARELLREWNAELIQTHSYRMTFVATALRLWGDRRPWIGFFHGATAEDSKVRLYHWLDRRLLGAADRVVVMSRLHAGEFARNGARVRVIHNAVIPLPTPAAAQILCLPPGIDRSAGIPLMGVVGRLSHEKGVDLFLEACRVLAGRGVAFQAVVAGDGPEHDSLQARCEAAGLGDRVFFLGQVTDVESLYQHLDLLVIPSRSEGLPNVLLEALAADVPA